MSKRRTAVDRAFGNLASFPGGLGPLPPRACRRGRVERWVWLKPAINAARITRNRQRMGQMQ